MGERRRGRFASPRLPRIVGVLGLLGMAGLLLGAGVGSASPSRSWSPPYHGKFTASVALVTGACKGSRNTTTFTKPSFDNTTGSVHLDLESNASGTFCPHATSHGRISVVFGFTTRNFTIPYGPHNVTLTWTLKWYAQLISAGGVAGSSLPASASYGIGTNGTKLCYVATGACKVFPNSSAVGSGYSTGWAINGTVANSTYHGLKTATVVLYLNATFGGRSPLRISSSLYAYTFAAARHGSYHAQAYLLFNPLLGGYAKLTGITVS